MCLRTGNNHLQVSGRGLEVRENWLHLRGKFSTFAGSVPFVAVCRKKNIPVIKWEMFVCVWVWFHSWNEGTRFLKKTVLPKEVRAILHSARVDLMCYLIAENYSGVLMNSSLLLETWHMAMVTPHWHIWKDFGLWVRMEDSPLLCWRLSENCRDFHQSRKLLLGKHNLLCLWG